MQLVSPKHVLAGPGSGKTRAIVARVAHLICERYVDPRAILVVTFTNKATAELATRMAQLMGPEVAANLVPVTFHKLCLQLLRYGRRIIVVNSRHLCT